MDSRSYSEDWNLGYTCPATMGDDGQTSKKATRRLAGFDPSTTSSIRMIFHVWRLIPNSTIWQHMGE
eukprot:9015192-Prorocentrum_lima.AAC.1